MNQDYISSIVFEILISVRIIFRLSALTHCGQVIPYVMIDHWWLMDSPHKGPVMCKVFPCHDVNVISCIWCIFGTDFGPAMNMNRIDFGLALAIFVVSVGLWISYDILMLGQPICLSELLPQYFMHWVIWFIFGAVVGPVMNLNSI